MDINRLSSCSYPLREQDPEVAFRVIADSGLTKLDLWGRAPHFSTDPGEVKPEYLENLVAQYGVRIANLGSYPGAEFAAPAETERTAELAEMRRTIELAQRFGARTIRVRPGLGEDPVVIDRIVPYFQESARYAEAAGVYMVMENHAGSIAGNPRHCVELCEKVGSRYLGVLYEPCNLLHSGVDYREAFAIFKDHIRHVHVKDGAVRAGRFERCHLGDGDVDVAWVFAQVEALGYDGDYALEYEVTDIEPMESAFPRWVEYALSV